MWKRAWIVLLPLWLLAGCQSRQDAAEGAIDVLQQLATPQTYGPLGFDSLEEVGRARLGTPIEIFSITLDDLASYRSPSDPAAVLTPSPEALYPVLVDGVVKSSLTVARSGGRYEPRRFGSPALVRAVTRNLREGGSDDFIVTVPSLNLYFLGRPGDGRLDFIPIFPDPRLHLGVGRAVRAEEVLEAMRPLAEAHDGLAG